MYFTRPLDPKYNRVEFSSGNELLDNYFRRQARQDVKRKLAACFVIIDEKSGKISGFYTLSSAGIAQRFVPDSFRKKLPKSYNTLPAILIGRFAVDIEFQGSGIGKLLLIDALKRCHNTSDYIGAFAVIVDPIDMEAEKFYEKHGFIKLPDSGKMFLPMKTIENLFVVRN